MERTYDSQWLKSQVREASLALVLLLSAQQEQLHPMGKILAKIAK